MRYVIFEADDSLDDYETDDLIEELESRGYSCVKNGFASDWGDSDSAKNIDLCRIEHLAVCGQKTTARLELFQMVNAAIGCDLTH